MKELKKDIKTKPKEKPKVLSAAQKAPKELMKTALLKSREKAGDSAKEAAFGGQTDSPQGYAADKVTQAEGWAAEKGGQAARGTYAQGKKLARKTIRTVKERKNLQAEKEAVQKQAAEAASREAGTATTATPASAGNPSAVSQPGKPAAPPSGKEGPAAKRASGPTASPRAGKQTTGKQTTRKQLAGKRAVKTRQAPATIKAPARSIKTAERAGKQVKTAGRAARQAQRQAKIAAKASQQAVRRARQAAQATARTARAAGRAVVTAVKATAAAIKGLVTLIAAGGWIPVVIILILVVILGAVFAFTGGGNSNAATPVSAEVEAYSPLIQKYARQHGIPEYSELIKAVMMQESGGRGTDPMQAAECGYNTRYPNTPNGITDPEYSIDVGIQNLAACLREAGAENPMDLPRIKLALQGYNYGNGYISWAVTNYGGYTAANAVEFSDMMAERSGWASYGDKQYVPHVLRYYPFGRIPMGTGSAAIVQVALTQEGNVGGGPYWSWYGFDSRVEWCACFVSWAADQCGYIDAGILPRFAGVASEGIPWFQQRGQFEDASYTPAPGDIIFFDWESDGLSDHVGIVVNAENGTVNTIEGNSGDECRRKSYPIGSPVIYGYGVPAY